MADILLIEPDNVLAKALVKALQAEGHKVRQATTAQAAVSMADRHRPDLVILELQLVEHSGIEFLYEFRSYSDWQAVPVVVHSLVPASEFHGSLGILQSELGVSQYLYKPQTGLRALIAAINQTLLRETAAY